MKGETFKNTIKGNPILSRELIEKSTFPQEIKDLMCKNIKFKQKWYEGTISLPRKPVKWVLYGAVIGVLIAIIFSN